MRTPIQTRSRLSKSIELYKAMFKDTPKITVSHVELFGLEKGHCNPPAATGQED